MMKMLIRGLAVTVMAVGFAGCATTQNYEKMLGTWVGADEADLVRRWGAPQQSYEANGLRFLTYFDQSNLYIPPTAPTYSTTFIGNTAYSTPIGGSSGANISMRCRTTFEVSGGKIVSWSYEGNNCVAPPPK